MPHSRFALDANIIRVVIDIETSLRGVRDTPHHHGSNFDGIAAFVVHFEFVALKISRPKRNRKFSIEWVGPMKSAVADGPFVAAKEDQDARFVRLEREKTKTENDEERHQPDRDENRGPNFRIIPGNITNSIKPENKEAYGDR